MSTIIIVGILFVGGAIGFAIAWLVKSKELEVERRTLQQLKEKEAELGNHFEVIANRVLSDRSKDFLQDFNQARKQHEDSVGNKEKGFSTIAQSVEKTIKNVEEKLAELEKQKNQQIGALQTSIQNVLHAGEKMHESAQSLKTVLSSASAVRGRWGESTLKNLLENCGLHEGADFETQHSITGEESSILRPDVVVNLPGPGRLRLAIDSKAGLEEYFKACVEKDEAKRKAHMDQFAQNLRLHIRALSSKEYQRHLDGHVPFVVMFIPGEAAVRAVFEHDINLYREAQEKKVMLASPYTIFPLIQLIAHAWKQQKSVENAAQLSEEVVELGARLRTFLTHIMGIGAHISQATKKFNEAASSWDSRVVPKLEKIEVLGGNLQLEASQVQQIEGGTQQANKILVGSDDGEKGSKKRNKSDSPLPLV